VSLILRYTLVYAQSVPPPKVYPSLCAEASTLRYTPGLCAEASTLRYTRVCYTLRV